MRIFYTDINSSTYLYLPTPKLPLPTNNTLTIPDYNVIYYSPWINYWYMSTSFSGVNVVRNTTTFYVYIQPPNPWGTPYYNYLYSSTGISSEYVLLKFVPKYVIDPYNIVPITCGGCS